MYSDCGTNFVGADRELRQAFQNAIQDSDFQGVLANDGITWRFHPPAAPHFGGLWEAGVRSFKGHLKRVLLGHTPTFEELSTLCARIEACLNSRPLAPLRDSVDDLDALTPAHLLSGQPIVALPQVSLVDCSATRLSRWQQISRMLEVFWKRWYTDYVQTLQRRSKWKIEREPIRIGQLVLLRNENMPPTKWALARVTETHPGVDGLVRVVTVRTAKSTLQRPIAKLALLPIRHAPEETSETC